MRVHEVVQNLIRGPEQVIKWPNYLTGTIQNAEHQNLVREDGA